MNTPYEVRPQGPGAPPDAPRLRRPVHGRMVAGVCAGLAEHLGVPVNYLRLGFVVAAVFGGAGVAVYLFLWAFTPQTLDLPTQQGQPSPRNDAAKRGRRFGGGTESVRNLGIGVVLVVLGAALFAQQAGLNLRLGVLLPMVAVAVGAVLAWSQLDDAERGRWLAVGGPSRNKGFVRLILGTSLAVVGLFVLVTQGRGLAGLWDVGVAALAVLAGAALIAAPWAVRLWNDLRMEQASRIRATERADIAAHLHDSVLQTLALIQRQSDDPVVVARLARAQERELRGWLYAGPRGSQETLAAAATEAAHEVEDLHGIPIELVVTGDRPLDDAGSALVRALREALANAVRHGSPPVSAYVEVGPDKVEAFVRDHGPGFDIEDAPPDRLGVRESILGRMSRHGGTARVRRLENGTEITLVMPVSAPQLEPKTAPEPASATTAAPTPAPASNPASAPEGAQR